LAERIVVSRSPQFTPRRLLGATQFVATQIGCGDLADRAVPFEQCVATVCRALDAGINVVDTAPLYENGYSEEIVGEAVTRWTAEGGEGSRQKLFVIDKVDLHDKPVAPQIDASLKRLKLEYTDAFVLHDLSTMDGWRRATAPGGAMDQLDDAVRAGKTRFRGISSHHPDVLAAAILSGLVEIVMFPVGPFVHQRFLTDILPLARKHRVGTLCFKTFGAGKLLGDTEGYQRPLANRPRGELSSGGAQDAAPTLPRLTVEECVHYTLTVDPDVTLLGMSFPNEQDAAFAAAQSFAPLGEADMSDIRRRAAIAVQGKGKVWWNPA
jgi:aryl-alcohol dehydrogenase-like predicted oxidoreductase